MDGRRHGYLSSEAGAVAPIVAISLVALIGMGGLAYDVSRGLALRAELQSAVDAAALAGATQLDGSQGAEARAKVVAGGVLAQNPQILADLAEANVVVDPNRDITFLANAQTAAVAPNGAQARFIQINLTPRRLGVLFGAFARVANFDVSAHAIAGLGTALCRAPPILICNPLEGSSQTFNGDANTGRGIVLQPAGAQAWQPGQYGLVDSPSLNDAGGAPLHTGAASTFDAIARVDPQIQCIGDSITVEPVTFQVADAFNVRFDIYNGQASGLQDQAHQPAMNTISGFDNTVGGGLCTPTRIGEAYDGSNVARVTAMALPRDACAYGTSATCNPGLGDGNWSVADYSHINFNAQASPNGTTRFQVYQWELQSLANNDAIWSGQQGSTTGVGADFAPPRCNATATQQIPDRRVISASVVNCLAQNISGRTEQVPVIARVDIFLTEPVGATNTDNNVIYGEILGSTDAASPAGQATLLSTVRLYG